MNYSKFLYILLLLSLSLLGQNGAFAGRINFERMVVAPFDLSARTINVKDLNGNDCALVKTFIAIPGVQFQGNVIKVKEHNPGEYWVYMTEGSKELRINVPGNTPIKISFLNTEVGSPLRPNVVYEIYSSIDEMPSVMPISSFNRALAQRDSLIKKGEYSDAIESLNIFKDSLKSVGESQYIPLVEVRINECKRRQTLEKMGFDDYGFLSEGMIKIRKPIKNKNGKDEQLIGFMDSVGNIVAQPKYHRGFDYNKGVAWVCKEGRWGCLNKKGAINVPLKYKVVRPIKSNNEINWMMVSVDSVHYGIVDYTTGQEVLPIKFENTSNNESPEDNPLFALYDRSQKKSSWKPMSSLIYILKL